MPRRLITLLALVPTLSMAAVVQAPVVKNSAGQPVEAQPVITVDPTGTYVAGGGGGGGGGAATVADGADVTQGAKADSAWSGTGTGSVVAILKAIYGQGASTSASPVSIDHTTPGTTDAVVVNGVATASAQATLNAVISTIGSTAPTTGINVTGTGPSGNARSLQTSTSGGLLPGQASPTSTRTTATASTATQVDSARTTRLLSTIQLDGSPTAAVYICFTQTTSCSATVYDIKVASGAADATIYTAPFGSTSAIYVYTTATGVVVNVSSWLPL